MSLIANIWHSRNKMNNLVEVNIKKIQLNNRYIDNLNKLYNSMNYVASHKECII